MYTGDFVVLSLPRRFHGRGLRWAALTGGPGGNRWFTVRGVELMAIE